MKTGFGKRHALQFYILDNMNHGVAPLFDNGQLIFLQTGRWTIITTISGAIGKKAVKWCISTISQLINICFNFIWHKLASENKTTVDNYLSARFSYSLDKTNFFFLSECHWQCYWRLVAMRLKQRINASTYHDPWFESIFWMCSNPRQASKRVGALKLSFLYIKYLLWPSPTPIHTQIELSPTLIPHAYSYQCRFQLLRL